MRKGGCGIGAPYRLKHKMDGLVIYGVRIRITAEKSPEDRLMEFLKGGLKKRIEMRVN